MNVHDLMLLGETQLVALCICLALLLGAAVMLVLGVCWNVRKLRQYEAGISFKRELLGASLSADEVVRIVEAQPPGLTDRLLEIADWLAERIGRMLRVACVAAIAVSVAAYQLSRVLLRELSRVATVGAEYLAACLTAFAVWLRDISMQVWQAQTR